MVNVKIWSLVSGGVTVGAYIVEPGQHVCRLDSPMTGEAWKQW